MKKGIKLALFDIDGTIFRSSLVIELVNGLVNTKVFPPSAKKEMEADYLAWLNRQGSYETYVDQVVKIYVDNIRGVKEVTVNRVVETILDWQKNRLYRFTRDLIKILKEKNYYLVAISGSPHVIVSKFADYLGFKAAFGSVLEVKNGVYTGGVVNRDSSANKQKVLQTFLGDHNFQPDLSRSIAVGDTEGDIPLLKLVENPIAFNPNRALAKYAKAKKWRIVVERKDVIYEIKNFSFVK